LILHGSSVFRSASIGVVLECAAGRDSASYDRGISGT
jgi:hypothetical protein